ncbi:ribonuclease HII, partial [Vibrio sp. Vb0598]|nr:ribonuclease HII [Vibrio sp. Vb0598]
MVAKAKTTKAKVELPPFEYPQGYQLIAGVDEVGR